MSGTTNPQDRTGIAAFHWTIGDIHVRPTRHGVWLAVMLMAMSVASLNFQSNASWMLTVLAATMLPISLVHAVRNVRGVTLLSAHADLCAAGTPITLTALITASSPAVGIVVGTVDEATRGDGVCLAPGERAAAAAQLPGRARGVHHLRMLRISSDAPFGLFHIWRDAAIDLTAVVHPHAHGRPLAAALDQLRVADAVTDGEHNNGDDFSGHRLYRPGDSPRRIDWKALARSDQLLTKEFSGAPAPDCWLDFATASGDLEQRLSELTRWVDEAADAGVRFGLRLPDTTCAPESGATHRDACLTALAACQGVAHG